jgi:hypothetical protein
VHEIGAQPLQRLPQLPLGAGGGNRVHLRLDQIGKGDIRVRAAARGRRIVGTLLFLPCWLEQAEAGGRCVEVDEAHRVASLAQGFGGAQAIGDVAAERGLLAQPGNVSHGAAASDTAN